MPHLLTVTQPDGVHHEDIHFETRRLALAYLARVRPDLQGCKVELFALTAVDLSDLGVAA